MSRLVGLLAIALIAIGIAVAQPAGAPPMSMPAKTLFVAQLDGQQVVSASSSQATGTGAFLLDSAHHALTYRLTYQGLENGPPGSIALYNFGVGRNGERIGTLCGQGSTACPKSRAATIAGEFQAGAGLTLENKIIGEFDSGRIYVEIVSANGKREIRGQLGANGAMVEVSNYTADLVPAAGTHSKGSGTAIFSETFLPNGTVSVFYAATVAGTSGAPVSAALLGARVGTRAPSDAIFSAQSALPQLKLRLSRDTATGGSFTGTYEVNSAAPEAPLAKRFLSQANAEAEVFVSTSRFPAGELHGTLTPVR